MTITPSTAIGPLASSSIAAARVFYRFDIDLCCRERLTLEDACRERGLDPQSIIDAIRDESSADRPPTKAPVRMRTDELVDYIIDRFHLPHREDLERLERLVLVVSESHGYDEDTSLLDLPELISRMRDELEDHMQQEEDVLFPWILTGSPAERRQFFAIMASEHTVARRALRQLAAHTRQYALPSAHCAAWRVLVHGLRAFDRDLRAHASLEEHVLFPRAGSR